MRNVRLKPTDAKKAKKGKKRLNCDLILTPKTSKQVTPKTSRRAADEESEVASKRSRFSRHSANENTDPESTSKYRRNYSIHIPEKKDPDYNYVEHRNEHHLISDVFAAANMMKGCIGTGILAMPLAFSRIGTIAGSIATIITAIICTIGMSMMVTVAHIIYKKQNVPLLDYGGTVELAFLTGPERMHKYSKVGRRVSDIFLCLNGLGTCVVYALFIARNLKQVIDQNCSWNPSIRLLVALLIPILLLQGYVRELKYLAPLSMIAHLCVFIVLIACFYYIFEDLVPFGDRPKVLSPIHWPEYFSIAIFALQGVPVIMAIENKMKNPEHFVNKPMILVISMCIVTLLYGSLGLFGFWKYGDDILESITLNVPQETALGQLIKIAISISVCVSFGMFFFIVFEITWFKNISKFYSDKCFLGHEYGYRTLFVLVVAGVAIGIPSLGGFIGLIGALVLSTLGLIIPSVIETVVYWEDPGLGKYKWRLFKNLFIGLFGLFALITGSAYAIRSMIHDMMSAENK